jgi:peptidyl-prolyl cis-trans isomerase A (cyclophilin A)
MRLGTLAFALSLLAPPAFAQLPADLFAPPPPPTVQVAMHTSMGDIVLELDRAHAPRTVANFLRYVREKHYDETKFYRVVPGFVIQAGSLGADGVGHPDHEPIPLEANNGLKNLRGSISMARNEAPVSAQAEYFIVLADNPGLDPAPDDMENKTGYAVFGHVISGMDVVDRIAMVPLGGTGPFGAAAPLDPVVIHTVEVLAPGSAPQN